MVPVKCRDAAHHKHIFTDPACPVCPHNCSTQVEQLSHPRTHDKCFWILFTIFSHLFQFAVNSQLYDFWGSNYLWVFPQTDQFISELVSFHLYDSGDCSCNQRLLLHRSQHISLHTFQPTHTPPHTLFLYQEYLCRGTWGIFMLYLKFSVVWGDLYWLRCGAEVTAGRLLPCVEFLPADLGRHSSLSLPLQDRRMLGHRMDPITHFTTSCCWN